LVGLEDWSAQEDGSVLEDGSALRALDCSVLRVNCSALRGPSVLKDCSALRAPSALRVNT
jgi:hypothetical protein